MAATTCLLAAFSRVAARRRETDTLATRDLVGVSAWLARSSLFFATAIAVALPVILVLLLPGTCASRRGVAGVVCVTAVVLLLYATLHTVASAVYTAPLVPLGFALGGRATRRGTRVVRAAGNHPGPCVPSSVGRRNPAHCTAVGKALLAFRNDEDIEGVFRSHGLPAYTGNTITSLAELEASSRSSASAGMPSTTRRLKRGSSASARRSGIRAAAASPRSASRGPRSGSPEGRIGGRPGDARRRRLLGGA